MERRFSFAIVGVESVRLAVARMVVVVGRAPVLLGEGLGAGPRRQLDLRGVTVLGAFVPRRFHLVVVREEGEAP